MNDDELLDALGRAVPPEVPPVDPERVRALRARAEAAGSTGTADPAGGGAPVTPLRSRRSMLGLLAAGSAAAGVAVGVGVASLFDEDPPAVPTQAVPELTTAPGVTATASLIDHTWGLEVVLDVDGLEPGAAYRMVFLDGAGGTTDAGGFVGVARPMHCRNTGAAVKADVARWAVLAPDGSEAVAAVVT